MNILTTVLDKRDLGSDKNRAQAPFLTRPDSLENFIVGVLIKAGELIADSLNGGAIAWGLSSKI
jgi:hypothetical protein